MQTATTFANILLKLGLIPQNQNILGKEIVCINFGKSHALFLFDSTIDFYYYFHKVYK